MTKQHPYRRIAEDLRTQIRDGVLAEGTRLPSVKAQAVHLDLAPATVHNAYAWLQLEGYVRCTPRGTFVADAPPVAPTAHHRLTRLDRTGTILARGEHALLTDARLVRPPGYIGELFDLDHDGQVIRREFTTGKGSTRLGFAVHWYHGRLAETVPALLTSQRGTVGDAIEQIKRATGRTVSYGREAQHARHADAREASALGLPIGSPVMAVVHEWSDDQGIIEYGEWVLPPLVTIGYEYASPPTHDRPPAPDSTIHAIP